jgi:hypothetical protein
MVTTDLDAFPPQLLSNLVGAVDVEVVAAHPSDLCLQPFISHPAR